MSIVVVGVNHRTAPIELLERLSIAEENLPKALHQLATYEHVLEGAILSTCNRVEGYAVVSKFHGGAQDLKNFLAEFCHLAPEDFTDHLYTYHDDGAIRHLLRVTAGVDSMVIGESEILGQVRRAFQVAGEEGLMGRVLATAARNAPRVGKRGRTETAIGRNPVSVSSAAVELARRAFDVKERGTQGVEVAIVGAGKMGRLTGRALAQAGAGRVVVVNRNEERGRALAAELDADWRALDDLEDVLANSDIVICSTTSARTVIDRDVVESALRRREKKPLFIVDIAVPRDVEPSVADLEGVVLRDIDDLKGVVEAGIGSRLGEVAKVEDIINSELEHFVKWERSTEVAPTIAALLAKAEGIRRAEIDRLLSHHPTLTPEQRDEIGRAAQRIVSKLLHDPIDQTRKLASSKQGHVHAAALRELFALDDESTP